MDESGEVLDDEQCWCEGKYEGRELTGKGPKGPALLLVTAFYERGGTALRIRDGKAHVAGLGNGILWKSGVPVARTSTNIRAAACAPANLFNGGDCKFVAKRVLAVRNTFIQGLLRKWITDLITVVATFKQKKKVPRVMG